MSKGIILAAVLLIGGCERKEVRIAATPPATQTAAAPATKPGSVEPTLSVGGLEKLQATIITRMEERDAAGDKERPYPAGDKVTSTYKAGKVDILRTNSVINPLVGIIEITWTIWIVPADVPADTIGEATRYTLTVVPTKTGWNCVEAQARIDLDYQSPLARQRPSKVGQISNATQGMRELVN